MYQRIVEFTRLFRERWNSYNRIAPSLDAISTADAASNPTFRCACGRDGIFFNAEAGLVGLSAGAGERHGR